MNAPSSRFPVLWARLLISAASRLQSWNLLFTILKTLAPSQSMIFPLMADFRLATLLLGWPCVRFLWVLIPACAESSACLASVGLVACSASRLIYNWVWHLFRVCSGPRGAPVSGAAWCAVGPLDVLSDPPDVGKCDRPPCCCPVFFFFVLCPLPSVPVFWSVYGPSWVAALA